MHNLSTDYKETIVRTADSFFSKLNSLKPPTYNTTGHSYVFTVTRMTFRL